MAVDYYKKYLKYKSKYLELKNQIGTGLYKCMHKDCDCKTYKGKDEGPCSGLFGLKGCGHPFNMHSRFKK